MPYNFLDSTGIIVPDTQTTLSEVQNEFRSVFGDDLDLNPSTPQGILISAETLARDAIARNNADIANQINPNLASGMFLDAICALFGIMRRAATKSTVTATLTGIDGTIIYSGTLAETFAGDRFALASDVTIPVSGTIDAEFIAVEYGPVSCEIGQLAVIVDAVLGWTAITNATAATLGINEESDVLLWSRRAKTLAQQGTQTNEAIISALYNTDGVRSLQFRENYKCTTEIIDGISMKPHSIYVCVDGGTDEDVAQSIFNNRSAGSGMNGSTSVSITVSSGQAIDVLFDRPSVVQIMARITVKLAYGAAGDTVDNIKNKVVEYANGELAGEDGFTVGSSVSSFEIAGAIMGMSGIYVQLCEIALASDGIFQTAEIPIAINKIAAINSGGVTVNVL